VSTVVSTGPPFSWIQHGAPPAPAGYQWHGDMQLESAPSSNDFNGTFLIFAQVLSVAGPPYTIGMASIRGHVLDENTMTWETPQLIETFGTQTGTQRYI